MERDTGAQVGKLLFSPAVDTLRRNTGQGGGLKVPLGHEMAPSPRYSQISGSKKKLIYSSYLISS